MPSPFCHHYIRNVDIKWTLAEIWRIISLGCGT